MDERKPFLTSDAYQKLNKQWMKSSVGSSLVFLVLILLFRPFPLGWHYLWISSAFLPIGWMLGQLTFRLMRFINSIFQAKQLGWFLLWMRLITVLSTTILPIMLCWLFIWLLNMYL